MRISSDKPILHQGFTLLEVLVVILLIGLSLGMLTRLDYSTGPRQLENQVNEFAGIAQLVLEEAVLGGDNWGIDFFREEDSAQYGYRWLHRQEDGWHESMPVGMEEFPGLVVLDEGWAINLEIDGLELEPEQKMQLENVEDGLENFSPDIWFYPGHESTPFTAVFSHADFGNRAVASDMLGRIRLLEPGS